MMLNKVVLDSYDQYIDLKLSLYKIKSDKVRNAHLIKKLENERPLVEKTYSFTNVLDKWFRHYDDVLSRKKGHDRKVCDIQLKLETLKINVKSQWS